MTVLLRLFADCTNQQQAQDISNAVSEILTAFTPTLTEPPVRYWKIQEYFEFCFALSPNSQQTFETLLNYTDNWLLLGEGKERSAVWLRSNDTKFLLPEIAWVELILSQPAT